MGSTSKAISVYKNLDFKNTGTLRNVRLQTETPSSPKTGSIYADSGSLNAYDGSTWHENEIVDNKVNVINDSNTEEQYISAKALYDVINPLAAFDFKEYIQNIINPVASLKFTALIDGAKFKFYKSNDAPSHTFVYSLDGTNWKEYTVGTEPNENFITLSEGETLYFRTNDDTISSLSKQFNTYKFNLPQDTSSYPFKPTFKVSGNIMTLIDKTGTSTTIPDEYCFKDLFSEQSSSNCKGITTIPDLPATTLTTGCYQNMFLGCSNITSLNSNSLPATTLPNYCYSNMFKDCTSLTNLPTINATTINEYSCEYMFQNCTSLTSISDNYFKATYIGDYGCQYMFSNTNITSIPTNINFDTVNERSCGYMFSNCTKLTNLSNVKIYCNNLGSQGCYHMFEKCTGIISLPNISYDTNENGGGFDSIFKGCTSLKDLSSYTLNNETVYSRTYGDMFAECTSLEIPPKVLASTLKGNQAFFEMFYGCTNLKYIPKFDTSSCIFYIQEGEGSFDYRDSFSNIFNGCSNIKFSETSSEDYPYPFVMSGVFKKTVSGEEADTDKQIFIDIFANTSSSITNAQNNTTYYSTVSTSA